MGSTPSGGAAAAAATTGSSCSTDGTTASAAGGAAGTSGTRRAAAPPAADCLGCRVTGALFGLGGGGYLAAQVLLRDPPPRGSHRLSLIACASTMFVFGMYRALF